MEIPTTDKSIGINSYASKTRGIGGVIRKAIEDYVVEEVLVDGSRAQVAQASTNHALGASQSKQTYLLCELVKRNWDTLIAVRNIAQQLGIDQTRIDIAGIKDARAVTAQHITIGHGSMETVSRVNIKDIILLPVGYFREKMSSYYLLGNHFKIRIRDQSILTSTVEKRLSRIETELETIGGIPNFFGHQRFGTTRPITHVVGKALLKGKFQEATMHFLAKPSPHEHPASREARLQLDHTQDFKQALRDFPRQLRFEKLMLEHLAENPEDFIGAFRQLPLKLRTLFVQAYQSYLFNCFLSKRMQNEIPLNTAVEGDYVVNVERSGLPMIATGKNVDASNLAEINKLVEKGKARVAIPLVGQRQRLSKGVMGEIENQILFNEEVHADDFGMNDMPEVKGLGGLRTALSPIRDFENSGQTTDPETKEPLVELNFMLLRGSYATMFLREIMKPCDPLSAGF